MRKENIAGLIVDHSQYLSIRAVMAYQREPIFSACYPQRNAFVGDITLGSVHPCV